MFHCQRGVTECLHSSVNMLKKKFAYEPQACRSKKEFHPSNAMLLQRLLFSKCPFIAQGAQVVVA